MSESSDNKLDQSQGLDVRELDMEAIRAREAEMRSDKQKAREELSARMLGAKNELIGSLRFCEMTGTIPKDQINIIVGALEMTTRSPDQLSLEAAQEELLRMLDIVRAGLRKGV